MAYVPKTWSSGTPMLASDLNHLQMQYQAILDYLAAHNHNERYYLKNEMDSYFWSIENDGSGSTLDADLLGGSEGDEISSGIENGVIGFWYGTLADFTGKLLTGYLNWHIADGTNGSEDLIDKFPVGASAVGSGYQAGTAQGTRTFKPAGSIIIQSRVLTIDDIMHFHYLEEKTENTGVGCRTGTACNNQPPFTWGPPIATNQITLSIGGGLGHNHDATFAGDAADLLPPFLALIPVQFGNYENGVWTP